MKQLFTFLFLLFNGILFAQSNYQSGYILNNSGDTLKGYINFKDWINTPRYIDFKNGLDDKKESRFFPNTIKGFQVGNDKSFISYIGYISQNTIDLTLAKYKLDTSKRLDTIFIQKITGGKNIDLYTQQDDIRKRYFVAELNSKPTELLYNFRLSQRNVIIKSNTYKGQLMLIVNKYQPENSHLVNLVNISRFEKYDLEQIINELNNHEVGTTKKIKSRVFIGPGLNYTATSFHNLTNSNISPKFDMGIDFSNNSNVSQFIARANFSFFYKNSKFKDAPYNELVPTGSSQEYYFNQYDFSFSPQLLFNLFNKPNFKVFIGAGVAFNFASYSNNKTNFINQFGSNTTTENVFEFDPFYITYPVEAGVVFYNKLELNLTIIGNVNYGHYFDAFTSSQINGLNVKYLFGK